MFKKKTEATAEQDIKLLIERSQGAREGNFAEISAEGFQNTELVKAYNEVIRAVLKNNTDLVMSLNESMKIIGDSSVVKNMVEKVNNQQGEIGELRNTGNKFAESAEQIKDSADEMKSKSEEITVIVHECKASVTESVDNVGRSVGELDRLVEDIASFREKAEAISNVAATVKSIAGTSNLLALNASIEAARAGDAGRGFAVVAEEIRSLAVSTSSSAEDIGNQIREVVENIQGIATTIEEVSAAIRDGNAECHQSLESFNAVGEAVAGLSAKIDDVSEEIGKQSLESAEFAHAVDQMAGNYQDLYDECMNTGESMYKISRKVDKIRSDFARKNSALTMSDWLTVFEVDHLIFTWRQYNNICGFEKLKLEQVNNPDGCKLGKWILARPEPMKSSAELAAVKKHHYALHKYSTEAWEFVQDGRREEALEKFLLAYGCYEELMKALEDLRKYTIRNKITE